MSHLLLMAMAAGYLDSAAVESKLSDLAGRNSDLVKVQTLGVSAGGRKILLLEIAAKGPVDPARRPAIFLGANITGYHNAGTQAALHFAEKLIANKSDSLLASRTFYVAPALNPDAHDAMFGAVKWRRSLNAASLDRDRDGLTGEDGPNDLNGDGRITQMRIPEPGGDWAPDAADARLMVRADPVKGVKGAYRVSVEGFDDDKDGQYNEDPSGGFSPDKNFAHGFNDADPESGPWAGSTPEAKAVMDFLLAHRNIALACVYGPANNLLELPRGAGPAVDVGQMRVTVPRQFAEMMGVDPNQQFTIDEIYERVKDTPLARGQTFTKEMLASFLGAGAATAPDTEDLRYYERFAEDYKKILEKAGLDTRRGSRQSQAGGLAQWLYYQYGVMAVELDVWGVPKKKAEAAKPAAEALSVERLEKMTSEEFLALGEERIAAFLKGVNAPSMVTATMLIEGVKSGKMTPARMAAMLRMQRPGGAPPGGPPGAAPVAEQADLMAYVEKEAPDAFVPWTPITLPDGTKGEVGGFDPFVEIAPPEKELARAMEAHTESLLGFAKKLAEVSIASAESAPAGNGLWRITASVVNNGSLPTHTRLGQRTRNWLPVRLEIDLPAGAALTSGNKAATSERLLGGSGILKGEWLVRGRKGAKVQITVTTSNAGSDRKEVVLQ